MNPNKRERGPTTGEFKRVIQFMEAAASKSFGRTKLLFRPRGWFSNITMTLDFDDKQRATVKLTGAGLGARITHGGTLSGCSKPNPISDALRLLMDSPEEMAREFGMLTGICCLCSRKLSDSRSVSVGYGSTCAKQYGMRWGQIGQADLDRPAARSASRSRKKQ